MNDNLRVGDFIKIRIPGETPWGIVTAVLGDGRVMVRIDNQTAGSSLHGHEYGDVVTVVCGGKPDRVMWELAPMGEQVANGPTAAG